MGSHPHKLQMYLVFRRALERDPPLLRATGRDPQEAKQQISMGLVTSNNSNLYANSINKEDANMAYQAKRMVLVHSHILKHARSSLRMAPKVAGDVRVRLANFSTRNYATPQSTMELATGRNVGSYT